VVPHSEAPPPLLPPLPVLTTRTFSPSERESGGLEITA